MIGATKEGILVIILERHNEPDLVLMQFFFLYFIFCLCPHYLHESAHFSDEQVEKYSANRDAEFTICLVAYLLFFRTPNYLIAPKGIKNKGIFPKLNLKRSIITEHRKNEGPKTVKSA
eukprot:5526517-Amphidinium_carterae.1